MSVMRIACVADMPDLLPVIAQAHLQAFGALLPDWNFDQALDELRRHDRDGVIPTTWVALDDTQWLGSVSLLENDDARIRQWSPWLASLYVQPQARGQGIGEALVTHCVQAAAHLGVAALYLYCQPAMVPYYQRLGWQAHAELLLGPLQIVVMQIEPAVVR
ncbi:GNAT family N-acetyltransferase [Xanthomonas campestris]|uniref:GNAT family N-acetyltransferase n=1 Tax=Xanthomonas campestris TaxID=339 RepID=UPI002364FCBE|nr:GNAT family N-acetyltransferase [Xanthomonas campestris]MEA9710610.1 GNAT family N-acetyltransferase [Xanthomonas campestris]MEA9783365.1 GNAT family N-acetyltransferase [Xanthomonas campestris pv. raphani]MEA9791346.1 GNAT family N-acetyltransferase [Xanthomonas campestris pv. raphani]MEA9802476.1 GNAT family N-acetyltransferase [Xanthomonas campestris pv. raphani]MEA9819649.1 GNAT family N-acetyltransferase [Xanthomonas campestris pv. raphani]